MHAIKFLLFFIVFASTVWYFTRKTPSSSLYKIVSKAQWEESQGKYNLNLSDMDTEFIHFAMADQLDGVISKFWKDEPEFLILEIDPYKLPGIMKYETNPGKTTKYYHLYDGSIPLVAVKAVRTVQNIH